MGVGQHGPCVGVLRKEDGPDDNANAEAQLVVIAWQPHHHLLELAPLSAYGSRSPSILQHAVLHLVQGLAGVVLLWWDLELPESSNTPTL